MRKSHLVPGTKFYLSHDGDQLQGKQPALGTYLGEGPDKWHLFKIQLGDKTRLLPLPPDTHAEKVDGRRQITYGRYKTWPLYDETTDQEMIEHYRGRCLARAINFD